MHRTVMLVYRILFWICGLMMLSIVSYVVCGRMPEIWEATVAGMVLGVIWVAVMLIADGSLRRW